jgi:hypothetical protein
LSGARQRPVVGSLVPVLLHGEETTARVVAHVASDPHQIHAQFDVALKGTKGHGWRAGDIVTLVPASHLLTAGMIWVIAEVQKVFQRPHAPGPYDGRVTS